MYQHIVDDSMPTSVEAHECDTPQNKSSDIVCLSRLLLSLQKYSKTAPSRGNMFRSSFCNAKLLLLVVSQQKPDDRTLLLLIFCILLASFCFIMARVQSNVTV